MLLFWNSKSFKIYKKNLKKERKNYYNRKNQKFQEKSILSFTNNITITANSYKNF